MISIIKYIIIAVLIFGIFRVFKQILPKFSIRKNLKETISRFLPLFEFVVWLIFIFWIFRSEISEPIYLTAVIIGISALFLVLIGFFILKDYTAGLVLKTEYRLQKGEFFETKKLCGKVSKLGFLFLELETSEFEKIKIPYGKISGNEIRTSNENSTLKKFSFPFSVEKSEKLSEIINHLKIKILNSPYSSLTKTPEINLLEGDSEIFNFEISYYCLNEEQAQKVKELFIC